MGYRELFVAVLVLGCASAQLTRICVPASDTVRCQNMEKEGSQVTCESVETRVECAEKLSRSLAHVGRFSDEELLLLSQLPANNDLRVVASIRDANRQEEFAFESVVVVPSTHTNGFEGLRGGSYCHPGLGAPDIRWSLRVLKALEITAARTDQCEGDTTGRSADELEVERLSNFFSAACRPGPWSLNATVDADLKNRFPNLCSMCTADGVCAGYNTDSAVNIAGVQNSNRHIQALDCLRTNGTVAYVAWSHVRDFFRTRNPQDASRFSLLCPDGSLAPLNAQTLDGLTSPCALVRQPWSAIVATAATANTLATNLRAWWPQGLDPAGNTWQSSVFGVLTGDQAGNSRVFFEDTPLTPLNYTSRARTIAPIDAVTPCQPAHRWCTVSAQEQNKCTWVRNAAYSLGLQPTISCQQRTSVFDCLNEIMESRADFFSVDSHYGYLARQHYSLSPVKLVQNLRGTTSRIAALIRNSASSNITRFGQLKDTTACFPEYGSLAYVAFIRAAQERGVISATECNYARAAGEFFSSACAPGAIYSSHSITASSDFNATNLCTACRPAVATPGFENFTCAFDWTNAFFGNNGSLNCLSQPHTDVAFVEVQNIGAQLQTLGLPLDSFRVLCRNDSLALTAGVNNIEDDCLLAHVVDAEVLTRRNDPNFNSLNVLLDALDEFFGYNTAPSEQLINLHIYSAFNDVSDLLFKDSTIGLTEPTTATTHQPASNYIELFRHLESCNSATTTVVPGYANRHVMSMVTVVVMGLLARYVVY